MLPTSSLDTCTRIEAREKGGVGGKQSLMPEVDSGLPTLTYILRGVLWKATDIEAT